jgi:uncharacterized protein
MTQRIRPDRRASRHSAATRMFFAVLGIILVIIGLIGAVLPLLPTTIFFILAAGCFARSNERLEKWVLEHPHFGEPVRTWYEHRAISPVAKRLALLGMAFGFGIFALTAQPTPWVLALGAASILACAVYVVTRPSGPA